MRTRLAAALTALLLASTIAPAQDGASGYSGKALSSARLSASGLIVLGEADGFLSVLDPGSGAFVARTQAGSASLHMMAARPGGDEIAVVDSAGFSSAVLRVISISTEDVEEVFSISLPESPLFLDYSPRGGIIALGMGSREGFLLLNADDGSAIPLPFKAGPSSFVALGSSETTMLLYSPAGKLAYVGVPGGAVLAETRAPPSLANLRLSQDKRGITAIDSGDLVVIDASSGKLKKSYGLKGCVSFEYGPKGMGIIASFGDGSIRSIGERQAPIDVPANFPPLAAMDVEDDGMTGIGTDSVAWRLRFSAPREAKAILPEAFLQVNDAAGLILDGREAFAISMPGGIFLLGDEGDGFGERGLFRPLYVEGAEGLTPGRLSSKDGILWADFEGSDGASIAMIDLKTGNSNVFSAKLGQAERQKDAAIRDMSASPSGILVVHESREAETVAASGASRIWQAIPGLQCGIWIGRDRVLFGKNLGGGFPTSLFLSQAQTGELLPLPHAALSVIRLAEGSPEGTAWGFGISDSSGAARTLLWRFGLSPFAALEIDSSAGERYDASFMALPDGALVYGFGGRRIWRVGEDGTRAELRGARAGVRKMTTGGSLALLLLKDGSFEIVSAEDWVSLGRYAVQEGPSLTRLE